MTTTEQLAAELQPTAAALVCAVADRDTRYVHELLTGLGTRELHGLAVVLASHVDPDKPFRVTLGSSPIDAAVKAAAIRFRVPLHALLSGSRERAATDARSVACYVARRAGMTSPAIGRHVRRDHSTVLYACTRVGQDPTLRGAADAISAELGYDTAPDTEVLAS